MSMWSCKTADSRYHGAMRKLNAFVSGFLSIFDLELDPTSRQSLPLFCSKEIDNRLYKRFHNPRSRSLLPVWDEVGQILRSAMGQYERTHSIETRSESYSKRNDS